MDSQLRDRSPHGPASLLPPFWRRAALGIWTAFLLGPAAGPACSQEPPTEASIIRAVVTLPPLRSLLEPLLPPGSEVTVLMRAGRSEHGYEFTPVDARAIARADVFVYVGLGLEPGVPKMLTKSAAPRRRVVCFADAVGIQSEHQGGEEHHDHDDDHAVDPHLWLDPDLVAQLIPALRNAVQEAQAGAGTLPPVELARLDAAQKQLERRIAAVDSAYREQLGPAAGSAIVTHHAAFKRLTERYGLRVAAVLRAGESEDTPASVAGVIEQVRAQGVKAIFTEPQYDPRTARRIADAVGLPLGTLDPVGTGDWFAMMEGNLNALKAALVPSPAPSPTSDP